MLLPVSVRYSLNLIIEPKTVNTAREVVVLVTESSAIECIRAKCQRDCHWTTPFAIEMVSDFTA